MRVVFQKIWAFQDSLGLEEPNTVPNTIAPGAEGRGEREGREVWQGSGVKQQLREQRSAG